LIWIKTTSLATGFHLLIRVEWRKHLEDVMTMWKSLTIVAVLLAGGTSLAMAQNGLPTGGEHPVAGGAAGGGYGGAPGYGYGWYGGASGYSYGYGYTYPRLYNYYRPHRRVRTVPPNH
jgi:hypothetical protein